MGAAESQQLTEEEQEAQRELTRKQNEEWRQYRKEQEEKDRQDRIEEAEKRAKEIIRPHIKTGADAIEKYNSRYWSVKGKCFRRNDEYTDPSLLSYEIGAVVARMTLRTLDSTFAVGIISSSLSDKALLTDFTKLKGGAGWELNIASGRPRQNSRQNDEYGVCKRNEFGQRIVLEVDGREGFRTMKLSQDGETQRPFFTNIPVPFRFAVAILWQNDGIEIESVEVAEEPQLVGGTIPIKMDE
ncbi:hypothetical protein BLNAU_9525 [Blattamonas nauphoetae]|uniref:Uncharacterized protein n=1 Tax=Blattamonas nauphoetae TaxID=2049346 RepID=A0ABQ9XVH9_9EUKA|nr:hypothetical protein BLNAU_9525 [Blattamonas nauphoetae]